MLPYLITFSLSILSYKFALKPLTKGLRFLCFLTCVLPPAILAGLRDDVLGRDWYGYGVVIWSLANHVENFGQLMSLYPAIEPGYKVFNYAISFISSDCHVFFFFHQLLLVSIAFFVAYRYRNNRFSEVIMLFYFLYVFNTSMTIIRQSIALMLCMLAYALWDSRNRIGAYVFTGLAGVCHVSAVFSIAVFVLTMCKKILQKHQILIMIAVIVMTYYMVDSFSVILTKLIDMNIFSWHYIGYADQVGDVAIHKTDVAFQIAIIIMTVCYPSKKKDAEVCSRIFFLALSAIVLNMFGNITDIAFRVAHYFVIPIAILVPRISTISKDNRRICLIFLLLLTVRFLYFAYSNGAENTVPYASKLLGI